MVHALEAAVSDARLKEVREQQLQEEIEAAEVELGRAGVEFLTDTGDGGACLSVSAFFAPLLMMFVHTAGETPTGWGGSGREGKGYPQSRLSTPVATVGLC